MNNLKRNEKISMGFILGALISPLITALCSLPVAWIVQQGYNTIAPLINFPTDFSFIDWYFMWLSFCFITEKIIPFQVKTK